MNENHLQQIFKNYIEKFEEVNNSENQEYYKWQIVKKFRPLMDEALNSGESQFAEKLKQIKKLTGNFIDNYTQPLGGLIKFAKEKDEWKTIQGMFQRLYEDDNGDLEIRQKKIEAFLEQSHRLREKYTPKSYLYKDDFHSVTGYLFLYDPDHNYIYKATHAQAFADCVEFYDDLGVGDHVKLKNYYRMCDQLVEAIKNTPVLMKTDASRFENGWGVDPETLYADDAKHILAFDIIYCCSTYNLFRGITFVKPKTKERQLMQEKRNKAQELLEKLETAKKQNEKLAQALQEIKRVLSIDANVKHPLYGKGKISSKSENAITVTFANGKVLILGTPECIAEGFISTESEKVKDHMAEIKRILKNRFAIESALAYAEKQFAPYSEYI